MAAARSWTGETHAVARAHHTGAGLELRSVTFAGSILGALGDPVAAFDWLIRTHALGARIPFPASAEGAEVLSAQPHLGFSFYGRQLFCAALDYDLGAPAGRLHSDGDLVAAALSGDAERLAAVLAAGAPVNAPTRFNHGAPALHLAIMLCPELLDPLLAAGADVNAATLRGSTPLMAATSAGADRALIEQLIAAGADLEAMDDAGFAATHVAAQFGRVPALEALAAHGASLSRKTKRGLEPIHVASGLGKQEVVEWLIARGVDPLSPSPLGAPAEIAEQEGHPELAAALRSATAR